MAQRPLNAPKFYEQLGLSYETIASYKSWVTAVDVFGSIASVLTIPTLSALIAQAAAVHVGLRHYYRPLNTEQLPAMADRGWTDPLTLGAFWRWRHPLQLVYEVSCTWLYRSSSLVRSFCKTKHIANLRRCDSAAPPPSLSIDRSLPHSNLRGRLQHALRVVQRIHKVLEHLCQ